MASVYSELRGFALAHRGCGELHGDADRLTSDGATASGPPTPAARDSRAG